MMNELQENLDAFFLLFIYLFFNEEYIPEILTGLKSIHPGYYPD